MITIKQILNTDHIFSKIGIVFLACLFGLPSNTEAALPNGTVLTIQNGSTFLLGGAGVPTPVLGEDNIVIGTAPGDTGTGSHPGPPAPGDKGGVTKPWEFFLATGYDFILNTPVVETVAGELDFRGWTVTWNGIPVIPMGGCFLIPGGCDPDGDGNDDFLDTGIATFIWSGTSGDPYTLDYTAHVPSGDPSGFGGVQYDLHLEGVIILPGVPPTTVPDSAITIAGNPIIIDVLSNDSSADGLDPASVTVVTLPNDGTTDDTNPNGTVQYTPDTAPDFIGQDTFEYTVDSTLGITSAPTTVSVDVQTNINPVANDDPAASSTVQLDNNGGDLVISVLSNDTDANNGPGLPGGIDTSSVTVLSQPAIGTCMANPDGTVTYSQVPPSVTESDTCTYRVSDLDPVNGALTSNVATINIDISGIQSDWDANLNPDIIPILQFDPGVPDPSGNTAIIPVSGTYFSMDVSATTTIYTTQAPGSDGGMIIGHDQIGGNSHTGAPTGNEIAVLDLGWNFFGNTGMTFTKNGGITGNPDGTLKFSGDPAVNNGQGKYQITWNGIPEIDLGGSPAFPQDFGFATINCDTVTPVDPNNPALCADGDFFELDYDAHVPPGDPSGFGGVQYGLRMTGTVRFLDGTLQTSNGTISVENRMPGTSLPTDSGVQIQCVGDCFDFTITGVNTPSVSVVLPLAGGIPASTVDGSGNILKPELRVLRNNVWGSFITNAVNPASNDTVQSAAMVAGGPFGLQCPPPGDAAYGALTEGHQCVEVTIEDDGLNDKDPVPGTIVDPAGIGLPVGAAFVDLRGSSSSSGCTMSNNTTSPMLGGSWWLLTGLVAWLGWNRRKQQH